jgi:hypothetical protein
MILEGPHSDGLNKELYLAKIELTLPGAQIYADNVHVGKAGNADIVSSIHDAFQSAKRQLLTLDLVFYAMTASPAELHTYCERIGFSGPTLASFRTLQQLIELHVASIPFENIDVLLGVGVDIPPPRSMPNSSSAAAAATASNTTGLAGSAWVAQEVVTGEKKSARSTSRIGNRLTRVRAHALHHRLD